MRVLAHCTQDPALSALFRRKDDIYNLLAAKIFSKPVDAVQNEERNKAKVVCLGRIHPMYPCSWNGNSSHDAVEKVCCMVWALLQLQLSLIWIQVQLLRSLNHSSATSSR